MHLNKPDNLSQCGIYRFNSRRNSALSFYRKNMLIQLKQGSDQLPDLSKEIDIDYYHLDEFKLKRDQQVFVMEDRHMYQITNAKVFTEMDELVYIQFRRLTRDNKWEETWEATDRGRILIEGVWDTSYMCQELAKLEELFRQKEVKIQAQ